VSVTTNALRLENATDVGRSSGWATDVSRPWRSIRVRRPVFHSDDRHRRRCQEYCAMDGQDWWSGGELVPLELRGTEQGVFVRREGAGPSMTLLHGFPSSSHDWAKIAPPWPSATRCSSRRTWSRRCG
jgi:hypothetical protein